MSNESIQAAVAAALRNHQSFALLSHVRPDGDAIGCQVALAASLEALGKRVVCLNEDGLPDNLAFLHGAERIARPHGAVDVEVAVALDTGTRPRLGEAVLDAVAGATLLVNIDHHVSNNCFGDLNLVDPTSPATGAMLYELLVGEGLPLPPAARDALYVAISTDTGSFQYSATTARTHEIAADLVRRGLEVGRINSLTYDSHPLRRLTLMRALLDTLELRCDGRIADWRLTAAMRRELGVEPEDSEGLIDTIRAIRGVVAALFFEELDDGRVRVSMRSKDPRVDVCRVAQRFGGGGHPLAAGIRMPGPLADARAAVLDEVGRAAAEAR